jgi:hypothetical protein
MSDVTQRLDLPLMAAAQALKPVTHNEALVALDALVHLSVLDHERVKPPLSPRSGDRGIVGPEPTGASRVGGKLAPHEGGGLRRSS